MYMKISIDDLFSLEKPIYLIDIRDSDSYNRGHIPGAIHIVSSELIYHPSRYLDKNKKYYLYCDFGYISEDVCRRLFMQGYRVFSILGGYQNYLLRK